MQSSIKLMNKVLNINYNTVTYVYTRVALHKSVQRTFERGTVGYRKDITIEIHL